MITIKVVLYALATLTCLACTFLLLRRYSETRARLLMWSTLCFACLSLNNTLLFADLVMFPSADLRLYRLLAALVGMLFLLYGFIWEAER